MRKRFLKTAAAMMAIGLVFSTCSVTALAGAGVNEDNLVSGGIDGNSGSGNTNTDTLPDNNTEQHENNTNYNENNAYIETNNANINKNNSVIDINNGTIGTNTADDPKTDYGEGGKVSTNSGTIEKNEGTVKENTESGIIDKNTGSGFVGENNGTINENSAKAESSESPQSSATDGGGVDENNGTIVINSGFVENNNGTIKNNSGFVANNGVTESYISYPVESDLTDISDSDIGYSDSYTLQNQLSNNSVTESVTEPIATIGNNTGIVQINGDISEAEKSGEYDENALVINMDGGLVVTNNGIVENHTGGTVVNNNGAVFNYGGEVIKTYSGIEYFSVSVNTTNGSQVYGQGFKEYDKKNWLGQSYNEKDSTWTTSSSEVTITPTSGYEIASLNIPDKYSEYVSATKNSDGTWTLSVKSGYNISLTPTATLIATSTLDNSGNSGIPGTAAVSVEVSVSSDSDSDSNDSGNKPAQNSNNDFQVSPPGSMMNQMMVNSVDFIGQGLSAPLSDVLQKIDNITAINNFQAMGRVIPSNENIMACGVVDFKNAFVNAATGNVDVPVEATVIAGNTYTVALSDGTIIEVQCTTNGILNIPFAANAQNLTFIIYGVQSNPFTASLE
ncbi:hypothetical protein UYO_1905 [Lachnospiraceae bacterium JC7]|nr:hypothetical protein UYO_1905 [Lachnospiraceae bacterium JC7]